METNRSALKKSKVIVFGGSGFLGSHVADALSNAGYSVAIFDKNNSPYLRDDQEMFHGDLLDASAVKEAVKGRDYVYNFAGLADIDEAKNKPVETVSLNVLGNVHVLEAAREAKVKRFVFASTVYVYSEAGSFYRASKQSAERFVEAYQERYGLDYTILRYGSLYGRRADIRNGIYRMLYQALTDSKIIYNGNADSEREYIHVEDAARLSVRILSNNFRNRHIILTGHERMAVKKLMLMISEMLPESVKLEFGSKSMEGHYTMTPYAFHPKIGYKLTLNDHVDLGQGIMDCVAEVYEALHKKQQKMGDWLIVDEGSRQ